MNATGPDGESIAVNEQSTGFVESVVFENGYPELMLADGRRVPLGQVLKVSTPGTLESLMTQANDVDTDEDSATSASGLPLGADGAEPNADNGEAADENQEPMNQGI